ncbi:MAG TPA: type II secretion system protein [Candidatus Sulfotelmatobacter sp.]|jgi:prepilin-type processing-associated H-X9-DG protein|nr:type II secretion system protein [Candidatus Sulfotelmatobacter sp.]
MKTSGAKFNERALTLVEVLVVIAAITILAAVLLPALTGSGRSLRTVCMSNLKQIDLGFLMYSSDFAGKYPMQVSAKDGGTSEFIYTSHTFPHFEKIQKYIPGQQFYGLLVCPLDKARKAATNSETFTDLNISYFLNVDCSTKGTSQSLLAGDRNLTTDGYTTLSGTLIVTTNINLRWTQEIHLKGGNLAFADGHAEWCQSANMNNIIRQQPTATNRLSIP